MADPTRCIVDGCERARYARERCKKHHHRALGTGEIEPLYRRKVKTPSEKFWEKVDGGDVGTCWNWTAVKNKSGHGRFNPSGYSERGSLMAHRWSYQELRAEIPEGLHLDHLCRNPSCVNPWHLEPVTPQVNTLRGEGPAAKNAAKTHCPQGHEYDWHWKGARMCRECKRANGRRSYARLRAKALLDGVA